MGTSTTMGFQLPGYHPQLVQGLDCWIINSIGRPMGKFWTPLQPAPLKAPASGLSLGIAALEGRWKSSKEMRLGRHQPIITTLKMNEFVPTKKGRHFNRKYIFQLPTIIFQGNMLVFRGVTPFQTVTVAVKDTGWTLQKFGPFTLRDKIPKKKKT